MSNKPISNRAGSTPSVAQTEPDSRLNHQPEQASGFNWRESLATAFYHTGVTRAMQGISKHYELHVPQGSSWPRWRKAATPKFVILCYHRIGAGGIPFYSELPQSVFEAQMRFLRQRYRVVSLEEVCDGLRNGAVAEPAVAVTFDDGYEGVFSEAFRILSKYRIPATVYLIADAMETGRVAWYDRIFLILQTLPAGSLHVDLDVPRSFQLSSKLTRLKVATEIVTVLRSLPDWRRKECCADLEKRVTLDERELAGRIMNWSQVKTMQQAGISFGSHTVTHPVVGRLTAPEMESELAESKRLLEAKLDCPVFDFAFPFGKSDECGLQVSSGILSRCGYRSAVTTVPGANTPSVDSFALRRVQIGVEQNLAMFAFRLNQAFLHADAGSSVPVFSTPLPLGSQTPHERSSDLGGAEHA